MAGLKRRDSGGGRYIYRTLEEATAKTGHFSVSSIKISSELGVIVRDYMYKEKLLTHTGRNQAKTAHIYYSANFVLKKYEDAGAPKDFAYLEGGGRLGYMYQYGEDEKLMQVEGAPPGQSWQMVYTGVATKNIDDLKARTPTLQKLYFWICRKYPEHVSWVNCSHELGYAYMKAREPF